jgi:hypothetical protein
MSWESSGVTVWAWEAWRRIAVRAVWLRAGLRTEDHPARFPSVHFARISQMTLAILW